MFNNFKGFFVVFIRLKKKRNMGAKAEINILQTKVKQRVNNSMVFLQYQIKQMKRR